MSLCVTTQGAALYSRNIQWFVLHKLIRCIFICQLLMSCLCKGTLQCQSQKYLVPKSCYCLRQILSLTAGLETENLRLYFIKKWKMWQCQNVWKLLTVAQSFHTCGLMFQAYVSSIQSRIVTLMSSARVIVVYFNQAVLIHCLYVMHS